MRRGTITDARPATSIANMSLKVLSVDLDTVALCGFQKRSTYHIDAKGGNIVVHTLVEVLLVDL